MTAICGRCLKLLFSGLINFEIWIFDFGLEQMRYAISSFPRARADGE